MTSIRIPVHGFVELSYLERQLIDSFPFQRLRKIQQLALTSYVYPGATHTRFEHSIGILYIAQKAYQAIWKNSEELRSLWSLAIYKRNEQLLRLYSLVHDLGHGPFSHSSDDLFCQSQNHELFAVNIIRETEIAELIDQEGAKFAKKYGADAFFNSDMLIALIENNFLQKWPSFYILRQILDSELDIDKMDYLLRDSYHSGVAYGNYDINRLIDCLTAVPIDSKSQFTLAIKEGGIHALEGFVLARYWMFVQVYFHKTRRIFDYYLQNFLRTILPDGKLPMTVTEFLKWHDIKAWYEMEKIILDQTHPGNLWAKNILRRTAWKQVHQSNIHAQASQQELFARLKKEILDHYPPYKIFLDYANKAPHSFLLSSDQKRKIPYVTKGGELYSIAEKSEVISNLITPINTFRIYAAPDIFEEIENLFREKNIKDQ